MGKNIGLKTVFFRGGCIGPNLCGAKTSWIFIIFSKKIIKRKKYTLPIGYKGKQVRDNIHSFDLVNCFWEFFKNPKYGEVYTI